MLATPATIDHTLRMIDLELSRTGRQIARSEAYQAIHGPSPRSARLRASLERNTHKRSELLQQRAQYMHDGLMPHVSAATVHVGDRIETGDFTATVTHVTMEGLTVAPDHTAAATLHYYDLMAVHCSH